MSPRRTLGARLRLTPPRAAIKALAWGAVGAMLAAGPISAQPKAAALPDWSGVWDKIGSLNIDPTTQSGKPQPNAPLNAELRKRYEDTLAARVAGKPIQDLGCLPEGPPGFRARSTRWKS